MAARFGSIALAVVLLAAFGADGIAESEDQEVLELGDVRFPHEMHYDTLGMECSQCHHETEAKALDIPHREYFSDFWGKCTTCHGERSSASGPLACSHCHHRSPTDIADETLSAKVVIHRSCWACHEVGRGREASRACGKCHTAKARLSRATD